MSLITHLALTLFAVLAPAPTSVDLRAQGELVLATVHGYSLEESVTGESPDRTVAVYLPPSYASSPERRYPVIYLLHGIGGTNADWTGSPGSGSAPWTTIQDVMDRGIAAGWIAEMIVVAPDQLTRGGGSFYTNSELTGGWEDFTVVDLVDFIDSTYRTLAQASSRGIAGHSMGGYGAIKLGMKHPDVFQVVFGMGAALLGFATDITEENEAYARVAGMTPAQFNPISDFWPPSLVCVAQAFSPNPERPPLFVDLPYVEREGQLVRADEAHARWESQMPIHMLAEYADNLRRLRGLRFEWGVYEEFTHIPATNRAFSERLTELGISHVSEEYNGDHRDRLWGPEGRIATEVLPYFSRLLERE